MKVVVILKGLEVLLTDKQTDICNRRVAFVTENITLNMQHN